MLTINALNGLSNKQTSLSEVLAEMNNIASSATASRFEKKIADIFSKFLIANNFGNLTYEVAQIPHEKLPLPQICVEKAKKMVTVLSVYNTDTDVCCDLAVKPEGAIGKGQENFYTYHLFKNGEYICSDTLPNILKRVRVISLEPVKTEPVKKQETEKEEMIEKEAKEAFKEIFSKKDVSDFKKFLSAEADLEIETNDDLLA